MTVPTSALFRRWRRCGGARISAGACKVQVKRENSNKCALWRAEEMWWSEDFFCRSMQSAGETRERQFQQVRSSEGGGDGGGGARISAAWRMLCSVMIMQLLHLGPRLEYNEEKTSQKHQITKGGGGNKHLLHPGTDKLTRLDAGLSTWNHNPTLFLVSHAR